MWSLDTKIMFHEMIRVEGRRDCTGTDSAMVVSSSMVLRREKQVVSTA